jgi:transcriptional regulator with XRE-family HTH domain
MAQRRSSELDDEFAAFLKATMESNGWSYSQFASETGVPRSMLHFLVNGERGASLHTVFKVCRNLGVTLSDVFPEHITRVSIAPTKRKSK